MTSPELHIDRAPNVSKASGRRNIPSPSCRLIYRKVAILGSKGVGKSSIAQLCMNGKKVGTDIPNSPLEYTHHGAATFTKYPRVTYLTNIVDTRGVSDSMELSRNAAIGVDVYVLVFSVTSRASLEQLIELNDVLYNMLGNPPYVPRVLVGNMRDLSKSRMVNKDVAEALAHNWGVRYVETCGLTGEGIGVLLSLIFEEMEADNPLITVDDEDEKDHQERLQCALS